MNPKPPIAPLGAVPYIAPGDQALLILDEPKFQGLLFDILKLIATHAHAEQGTDMPSDSELRENAALQYAELMDSEQGEAAGFALADHVREHAVAIQTTYGHNILQLTTGLEFARDVRTIENATRERLEGAILDDLETPKNEEILFGKDGHQLDEDEIRRIGTSSGHTWGPQPIPPQEVHRLKLEQTEIDTVQLSDDLSRRLDQEYEVSRAAQGGSEDQRQLLVNDPIRQANNVIGRVGHQSTKPLHTLMEAYHRYKIPLEFVLNEMLNGGRFHLGVGGAMICTILDQDGEEIRKNNSALYYQAIRTLTEHERYAGWGLRRLMDEVEDIPMENGDIVRAIKNLSRFPGSEVGLRTILETRLPGMPASPTKIAYQEIFLKAVKNNGEIGAPEAGLIDTHVLTDLSDQELLTEDLAPPVPPSGLFARFKRAPTPQPPPILTRDQEAYADGIGRIVLSVLQIPKPEDSDPAPIEGLHEKSLNIFASLQRVLQRISDTGNIWDHLTDDSQLEELARQKGLERSAM